MRDALLAYGDVVVTSAGTAVTSPNVLENLGPSQTVGMKDHINLTIRPSRDMAATEKITLTFEESDDDTAGNFKATQTFITSAGEGEAGQKIKFRYPRTSKKFSRVKVGFSPATGGTCTFDAFVEIG